MSVDCDSVAGIGVTLEDIEWPEELQRLYEQEIKEGDGYLKEENSFGDDDYILDEFLEGKNIYFAESGSNYSGITTMHLFATDPINGLDGFVRDMQSLGFNITRGDLKFISETLWW